MGETEGLTPRSLSYQLSAVCSDGELHTANLQRVAGAQWRSSNFAAVDERTVGAAQILDIETIVHIDAEAAVQSRDERGVYDEIRARCPPDGFQRPLVQTEYQLWVTRFQNPHVSPARLRFPLKAYLQSSSVSQLSLRSAS